MLVKNFGDFYEWTDVETVNGVLFFTPDGRGAELWKTDGTAAGTFMLKNIGPYGEEPSDLTNVNGTLFFTASDGIHGQRTLEERWHGRRHSYG